MRRQPVILLCAALTTVGSLFAAAIPTHNPTEAEIQQIIQQFAAKETAFQQARDNYTFRQDAKIIEFDDNDRPGGKYEMVTDILFGQSGKREEQVVYAPVNTLSRIIMSPEDEQDIRSVLPFVLTSQEIDQYYVRYLGWQQVDEIGCYVFAVKPKALDRSGKRYFEGEIWVDDRDHQIVKTYGRATGYLKHGGQQFPKFETYREQINGKYWFPTYTYADDILNFPTGPQRIKVIVEYKDYKQFKSDVVIKVNGAEMEQAPKSAPTTPPETPKPPQ